MAGLSAAGFVPALQQYVVRMRPLLGICLGIQMMLDDSDGFGEIKGSGLIPGRVTAIDRFAADGRRRKLPLIGWAGLQPATG